MPRMRNICNECGQGCDRRCTLCFQCSLRLKPRRLGTGQYKPNAHGYLERRVNGVTCLVHRLVMQEHLGRTLQTHEHVHHRNGDRADNRLENLQLMEASEHMKEHMQGDKAFYMSALGHAARWGCKNSKI